MVQRYLSADERRLVQALIRLSGQQLPADTEALARVRVSPMEDGGMGSLRFEQKADRPLFGREISQVTFHDLDGVPVLASLSISAADELHELDMFKGDFSPLLRIAADFDPFPPGASDSSP